ncbi:TPA: histidinol-phosphate transaminase [Legionella feeleii]|uniref:Histidinol-phosphate aminotransferase n=1 Tax=Legionella feeleii TaxID=453 RepID=A0A378ITW2_9GAMM|nr:histidinol-phosphate transaminase [Legionella feeleii]STX38658.1 histidinol-phosphate aminotransferase [Legionella feeleii]
MSVLNLIRPDLVTMKAYVPNGDELNCRLHANESPQSPIPFMDIPVNHYPDFRQQQLVLEQLAEHYQIPSEQMVLTRGSDDGIELVMRLFLRAGIDSILQCPPTFPMYAFYARLQQAEIINCPLDAENNFSLDLEKLLSIWKPDCKIIMLCQPNNPTANLLDLDTISHLCKHFKDNAVVVVDEAYIDFTQFPSAASLLASFDNLIVLRTLSKAYGLAGLRLGTVIAQPQLIQALKNIMPPYTLSSVVLDLAKKALTHQQWFAQNVQQILNARTQLMAELKQSPWIDIVYPSRTNFMFVRSAYASRLVTWFAEQDIAVRHFAGSPLLQNYLRISVGDESQNQRLLMALNTFRGE